MSDYHNVICEFDLAFEPAIRVPDDRYAEIVADELGFDADAIEIEQVYQIAPTDHIDDGVGDRGATEVIGVYDP
jgi:hypothetical protein